ncbi:MAG: c-type cytochrome biogenesis protein CcsB [Candidatus Schekmanbacteria bacterium RBG_13_48_7]|uniref:C-type cytochrome biogenesis protein CcsB n=1 Tax=Candidatus Schekmanbacteria bacterium RBG_13_48_7 TaxID=1817878 RepID=A0A1F7RW09_9BACT|nr:MAG: c-type cytochrome biogenesis protein CcsB [Candidatus Schekmanbacteria bacterium RBG_13_48_7]
MDWNRFLLAGTNFQIVFGVYVLASILYLIGLRVRTWQLKIVSSSVLWIGLVLNTCMIVSRWHTAGRPPFKTLYESLIFLAWCIVFVYLIIEILHKVRLLGIFATIAPVLIFIYSLSKRDVEIVNLPAALQSGWFIPHVLVYFIGYAALFISFATAVLYLFFPEKIRVTWSDLIGQEYLDFEIFTYKIIVFGFTFLTIGLLIGAVWAKSAWGDYWSWDPKESWSLITWLTYTVYLHLRYLKEWRGKKAAWFAIIGFLFIMFTYLGMNALPTSSQSVHVYTD